MSIRSLKEQYYELTGHDIRVSRGFSTGFLPFAPTQNTF